MAANKLKLRIRSLKCEDIVDELNKTKYSDICDTMKTLNISGDELITLNELDVRLKYGNRIEKKKLQRLQMLVFDVQTAPEQIFPNDSPHDRVPSAFKTSGIAFAISNAKQSGDALLEELRNRTQIGGQGEEIEYQNQMIPQTSPSHTFPKQKPVIQQNISLYKEHNQFNTRIPEKETRVGKIYEADQFEFFETVEYENTEEFQKDVPEVVLQSRPTSSTEYITLMDSEDQPVYEEISNEEAQNNNNKRITQPSNFCEWSVTDISEVNQRGPQPPPLPQRDRNQVVKQKGLKMKVSRKCETSNTPEIQSEDIKETSHEESFYEVPVSVASPIFNLRQHEFYRDITRMQGNAILQNAPVGTYLLRTSTNKAFFAVLMIKGPEKVLNIPTGFEADSYWLETQGASAPQKFQSLSEMLSYYSDNQLNGCKLLTGIENNIIRENELQI